MNALIDAALGRTRMVLATLVMVLIAGTYAYITVPKESDPDIRIPVMYVNLSHEGISPEDAERLLVRPIEKELRNIEGIKEMQKPWTPWTYQTHITFPLKRPKCKNSLLDAVCASLTAPSPL